MLLWIGQAAEVKRCVSTRNKKGLQCPSAPTFSLLLSGLARVHKRTLTEGRTNSELEDAFNIVQPWTASSDLRATLKWNEKKTAQDGSGTPMFQQTRSSIHEGCICEQ